MSERIVIRGAREHNLRNIDLEIPRDALVVITGLSGSGKSSLAFDTIYAEGQRRYVESLSAYARQFLDQMEKPDVDSIEGLSPAISIEQRTTSRNPRSTVGTVTEVYDFLRLLYATVGHPHCIDCGREIASQSSSQIAEQILKLPRRTRVDVLAPVVSGRKGEYRKEISEWRRRWARARIDGEDTELTADIKMSRNQRHDIDVIIDRLTIRPGAEKRLLDAVDTALGLASGTVIVRSAGAGKSAKTKESVYSTRFACSRCGTSYPELSPRLFSFNSPQGACKGCNGIGKSSSLDPDLVVTEFGKAVEDGAIRPWGKRLLEKYKWATEGIYNATGTAPGTAFGKLPARAQQMFLHGSDQEKLVSAKPRRAQRAGRAARARTFAGILPILERRYRESESEWVRGELERFMTERPCTDCGGRRLRPEALAVTVGDDPIDQLCSMPVADTLESLRALKLSRREQTIAKLVLKEITERLEFLTEVGLGYLSLERPSASLSGGEAQRVRLATQIGAGLSGVLYVLDEPSIGLHSRDHRRLLGSLRRLSDAGNTVVVVEHDADTIKSADHVVDMGPGAGIEGGDVVAVGSPAEIMADELSLTGSFLAGRETIAVPRKRRKGSGRALVVKGARHNNLCDLDVEFPLGRMVCVTGVSGSGKSSLVIDTLYAGLARELHNAEKPVGELDALEGIEHVDKVIDIDQSPIGRTPRSNAATYTGLFSDVRDIFTQTPEARMRGYAAGRFSFNVKGGRCETCGGDGMSRIEMHFLPDIYVTCDVCQGRRYNRETLEVRYKGKTIADVLDLTVAEALEFLDPIPSAKRKLETMASVGLGYIGLGQPATTLSGGEAQRIKLARELARKATGQTVYVLDEPTTGLHFADVRRLLDVLARLVDAGNTVVVIEHHLDVIKSADWVIDLGPEGGSGGGGLVVAGTPEQVARHQGSHTGLFLANEAAGMAA